MERITFSASFDPLDADLIRALVNHDLVAVRAALGAGANPNCIRQHGSRIPAFIYATAWGDIEAMQLLIDAGANPNTPMEKFVSDWFHTGDSGSGQYEPGDHALTVAARHGHLEAVQFLLAHARPAHIEPALARATAEGYRAIVERLVEASRRF